MKNTQPTTLYGISLPFRFENGRDYHVLLQVRSDHLTVQLDGQPLLHASLAGRRLSLRPEVELSTPLGIASFATRARVRTLRWRPATSR